MFLLTYLREADGKCSINWLDIIEQKGLASLLNQKLQKHSKFYSSDAYCNDFSKFPMASQAINELATLMFNLLHFNPSTGSIFAPSIQSLFTLLCSKSPLAPINQPYTSIINALLNFDETSTEWQKAAFPRSNPTKNTALLISSLP